MKVIITEGFDKEEGKLKNRILSHQIADLIENIYNIDDIQMIPSIKRLKVQKPTEFVLETIDLALLSRIIRLYFIQ